MFNNVGKKIKSVVKTLFWVVTVLSVISGILLIIVGLANPDGKDYDSLIRGVVTLIVGPIAAWCSSLALYAFGELVDNTTEIKKLLTEKKDA